MNTNPLTPQENRQALRLGVARAMSEAGLIPSEVESKLATMGWLEAAAHIPEVAAGAALGGGALVGAYAGHVHHQIDQTLAGEDDPEIAAIRKKTDGYHKMQADLLLAQQAANQAPVPPVA